MTDGPIIEDVTVTAQDQLELYVHSVQSPPSVHHRSIDVEEERVIQEFWWTECSCMMVKGGNCSSQFTAEHYLTMRASAAELTWSELNMVLMVR